MALTLSEILQCLTASQAIECYGLTNHHFGIYSFPAFSVDCRSKCRWRLRGGGLGFGGEIKSGGGN